MTVISFNENWIYYRQGEEWNRKAVNVPHDAMFAEKRNPDIGGGLNTGWFEGYDYVYEKKFSLPEVYKNKHIVFEFEGVYHNAEVYINGIKAAFRPYGYTNFYVEADKYLKTGEENTIKVIARNADQPNSRWYSGAGIYRPVNMYILPEKHILINGVKIKTVGISPVQIEISIKTNTKGNGKIDIYDNEKHIKNIDFETEGVFKKIIGLPDAKLWDIDNPNLYKCRVTFEEDSTETFFGIRLIECDAQSGFKINGKRVILRGACIHHDNGLLGAVAHPFAEFRKIRLLKETGYNAVRSAHNPCSKAMLDACDKLGMLMVDEYVDVWYIHKTKYDYSKYFSEWWKQDLSDMVEKDYNHPSVVMYSIGNEVSETAQKKGIKYLEEMVEFLHQNDTRPVTCGINIFFNFLSSLGFGVYSDKKAIKSAWKNKHLAIGSEFFNQLAGKLGDDFMKIGATLRGCDCKTRDAFSKLDVSGYNYGILRYKKDMKKYPQRVILGSETFCVDTYKFYEFAKKYPAIIGDFVWAGMDYLGEVGVGAWEYRSYAKTFERKFGWLTAGSGRIDITGKLNCEAAYTRVVYDMDNIRIGVVPVNEAFSTHSPSAWKMSNAVESWSWDGCEGKKTLVEVYTKAYKVALFINGKKAGVKKFKKNCRFIFKVKYEKGNLTAIAFDRNGNELYKTSLYSGEPDTKLTIEPENKSVTKDGLCYIRFKYTDKSAVLKPLARGNIEVKVENGTLLGLGHACSYNEEGYLNNVTDTYYGEALAIIKPSEKDSVIIKANSPFGSAETKIKVL